MKGWHIDAIKNSPVAHRNKHLIEGEPVKKKKSKYGNVKTEVDGILFDSGREAAYYKHCKLLLKAGMIGLLEIQPEFELNPGGTYSFKYRADFAYTDMKTGEKKYFDVKGCKTKVYLKKKKLMKKVHGIDIIEIN